MKPFLLPRFLLAVAGFCLCTRLAFAQHAYYFPEAGAFDPKIPTPEQFLGYAIGSHYTRHDRIVAYLQELDRLSDKVSFQTIGKTYEERPLVIATITSPENHRRLNDIQKTHLTLVDPTQALPSLTDLPVLVHLGYSVHGNETSSGETALLTAYYLTASQSEETGKFLREAVIFIDPALNPDGRDRAAHWANTHKSFPPVADPLDREHNEGWPSGNTNHYWNNLNRDWLAAVHVESQARLQFYHQWYPNVVIDFHEMGTSSTYYFEPSKPYGSESPLIPRSTYEVLNVRLAQHHAKALDGIGALYWTKEVFDNIAPIYGSTYPDFQGGVGITFEVGSSRGLVQESPTGPVTFASTIRKHLLTGIATVRGAVAERATLLKHQREFFRSAVDQGKAHSAQAFVFGSASDESITQDFLKILLRHRVQVYELANAATYGDISFAKGHAYVVPAAQPQFRIVHSIFEETTTFVDSIFHDVTGWSLAHAYSVPFAKLKGKVPAGPVVKQLKARRGTVENGPAPYAYLLDWADYNASKALYPLLAAGVVAKVTHKPFTVQSGNAARPFGYGSVVIPVALQTIAPDSLHQLLKIVSDSANVRVQAVNTGLSTGGIDLGSNNIKGIVTPKAAMLVGGDVNASEAGEVWFLLSTHAHLPITKIDHTALGQAALSRYNVLVLVSGNYSGLPPGTVAKIKQWVSEGGTLITFKTASEWAVRQGIVPENLLKASHPNSSSRKTTPATDYVQISDKEGAQRIGGSIYRIAIDPTHPIGFGLSRRDGYVLRNGTTFLQPSRNPYQTVATYAAQPLVNGYVSKENLKQIAGSAAIVVAPEGRGKTVLFADNPTFRNYWHSTSRLFLNAVFFGSLISVPSSGSISQSE